jgi:hypothetical protein
MIAAGFATAMLAQAQGDARAPSASRPAASGSLPKLGAQLTPLPDGAGKATAEAACLPCHASDLLRQQRLTRQQWTATLTKMGNWGAVVADAQKDVLLDYLAANFGPDNTSFQPVVTSPIGR